MAKILYTRIMKHRNKSGDRRNGPVIITRKPRRAQRLPKAYRKEFAESMDHLRSISREEF